MLSCVCVAIVIHAFISCCSKSPCPAKSARRALFKAPAKKAGQTVEAAVPPVADSEVRPLLPSNFDSCCVQGFAS